MITQIVILVVLILLNAYFAASEIAFISLNDTKIEKQAKEGNKKARQIQKMLKNPSEFLATIQIGITLAGFLSSAFEITCSYNPSGSILSPFHYKISSAHSSCVPVSSDHLADINLAYTLGSKP